MSLIYQNLLNQSGRRCWLQCRQFATVYTKTLNMPVTKFPLYVKKNKRPEHDGHIREVRQLIRFYLRFFIHHHIYNLLFISVYRST